MSTQFREVLRIRSLPRSYGGDRGRVSRRFTLPVLGVAVFLLALQIFSHDFFVSAKKVLLDACAPVLTLFQWPIELVGGVGQDARSLLSIHTNNQRLANENQVLQQWQAKALQLQAENNALRQFLNLRQDVIQPIVAAKIVSNTLGSQQHIAMITAGEKDGVVLNSVALGTSGVLGRVIEAGRHHSRVLLLSDTQSKVPVVLGQSRQKAIVTGDQSSWPLLNFLPDGFALAPEEKVFTSGEDGIFPAGLWMGTAFKDKDGQIRLRPAHHVRDLEYIQLVAPAKFQAQ